MAMFNSNVGLPEGTQLISSCNEQGKTQQFLTILPSLFLILQEILYPLVNVYITMEKSTIFNGKIHYK